MTIAAATDILSLPPPQIPAAEAQAFLAQAWGIEASAMSPLVSERDCNFRVESPRGQFVLKFTNAGENPDVTAAQTAALMHLETVAPGLPVPRVMPALSGGVAQRHQGHTVRLLSWLDGLPLHQAPRGPDQIRAIASAHGQMADALSSFRFAGGDQHLQWDIQHALSLRENLAAVGEGREKVARLLDCFARHASPQLPHLRRQFGHNDLNPYNLLLDPADPGRLAGILDFGDMVRTPVACELAVGIAYHCGSPQALENAALYLAAFTRHMPVTDAELAILPELIMARLCTTIVITSWRAAAMPENRDYILRNQPAAWAGMAALLDLPREHIIETLAEARA